ncbi:hypothetical protein RP20_CCG024867 [Aedes albopictus]|nr:hypothetical protein RP20_CCG024867 [Aedes albopictus]
MKPSPNWFIVPLTAVLLQHYCHHLTIVDCHRPVAAALSFASASSSSASSSSSLSSSPMMSYGDSEILKLTQSPAGSDARLRCGIKEYHADHMNSSDVRWYFKPCGEGTNRTSCTNRYQLDHIPWRPIDCEGRRCRVTLFIRNASEADSGLYRCSIHPYRTDDRTQFDIQLTRTFQLDVIKSLLDETVGAPELLDNLPANTTALLDSQIVLQCRVYSKVQPSIKWFRRINLNNPPLEDHNFNQDKSIRYLENFYELVPSSGEKPISEDVYLSKLILYNVSERDIGIYVCVGINYGGVNTADAYVNVVHPNGSTVGSGTSVTDLMVLFLIPLGLALIPLIVWICFVVSRRCSQETKSTADTSVPSGDRNAYQTKGQTGGELGRRPETPLRVVSRCNPSCKRKGMPIRSRRKVATRRRETVFPESENSRSELFVNNDRQRRQKGRVVEQLVDSPSVIMLSSAENTPGPLVGLPGIRDGSVVDISLVPGRATRLTDVDMVLEETDMRSHRARTQLFALDETNTSVVNLDETEMIIRDRPKSSVAQRWTRSASLAPVDIVGEARRSSVYSMVTKRNRRGAAGARVAMSGASIVPEDREANDGAGKDLSQITEEQSTSPGSSGAERTPQPVVRELVIQTRTMLRQGKKWSPEQGRAKSASRATSLESKVSRRKRKDPNPQPEQPIEHVSAQKKPESSSTETASRESSQFSKVSKRKRPKHAPDKSKEATSELSEPDRSSELSGSRSASQVREPRSKKRRTEPNKDVSLTNNNEILKDLSSSDNQDTASTSRRPRTRSVSRPRQTPASLPKRGRSRTRTIQKEQSSPEKSDPDTTSKRIQTRSASRARKPEQTDTGKRGRQRPRVRAASESVEQATQAETQPSQAPSYQKQRGRPRKRITPDDSVTQKSTKEPSGTDKPASPSDLISTRPRTRSVSRSRQLPSDSKSSAVRKRQNKSSSSTSVQQDKSSTSSRSSRIRIKSPAPLERSSTRSTPTRAKSVPRNVLSPPPSTASKSLQHIPIYRRYAEQVLQLTSRPKTPKPKPTAPTGESDIYSFDSLSQSSSGGSDDNAGVGKGTVKASKGGSTVKKRANNVSRNSKKTPLKKAQHHQHPTVFGTDMYKISSVVKKIGGGPVRRRQEDPVGSETTASEVASRNVVPTSTLAALVQSQQPSNAPLVNPRSPSPAIVNDDDHHHDDPDENHGFEIENIPNVEMPTPLSPPRLNPQIHRIMQQKVTAPQVHTPDKTQPNATLNFSPLGASSPWRVQNENILPKTFYFARSADMLPSYESDLVIQDENRPQAKPRDEAPALPVPVLPPTTASPRSTNIPPTNPSKPSAAVFSDIQKSYEQLKATSEMSEKLIAAMRKYKSNVHNQTTSMGNESSPEALFAKFREYEENMKKTYLKLKQWYDRSKRSYSQTMQAIEQAAPKTQAQQQLVENFRRNSQRFVTMMTDLESAMNDSNLENLSPPKSVENRTKPAFKDVILTERNLNDRNRSPLKTLNIVNLPPRFSPIKSPLVKASFASFTANRTLPQHSKSRDLFSRLSLTKPTRTEVSNAAPVESVIEVADTMLEAPQPEAENTKHEQPQKDLFGFESDCEEEDQDDATNASVNPTPVKITRETLKERLQSVRKLLPQPNRSMIGEASSSVQQQSMPRIFNSPQRRQKRLHTIQSVFSSSTPLGEKRNRWAKMGRREPVAETAAAEEPNVSAIETAEKATCETRAQQESPPAAVFDEPEQELASASINNSANRTYGRAPRRNVKRKRNIYLANLGLSESEEEEEEEEQDIAATADKADPEWTEADSDTDWANAGKQRKKRRQQKKKQKTHNQPDAAAGKKKKQKKTVEQVGLLLLPEILVV